jgi:hypothetical protein
MRWTAVLVACSLALMLPASASAAPPAPSATWTVISGPAFPAGSLLGPLSCSRAHTCLTIALDKTTAAIGALYRAPSWTSVPVPVKLSSDALFCTAPLSCEGLVADPHATQQPVHWNGSTWRPQAFPKLATSYPVALTCVSSRFCVTVGSRSVQNISIPTGEPLIAVWNGRVWTDQHLSLPRAGGVLMAVSCGAVDACMAVGERDNPNGDGTGLGFSYSVAYHYNGSTWKPATHSRGELQSTPLMKLSPTNPVALGRPGRGVSCHLPCCQTSAVQYLRQRRRRRLGDRPVPQPALEDRQSRPPEPHGTASRVQADPGTHDIPIGAPGVEHRQTRRIHVPPPVGHAERPPGAVPSRRVPVPASRWRRPARLDGSGPPDGRYRCRLVARVRHQPHPADRRLASDAGRAHRLPP